MVRVKNLSVLAAAAILLLSGCAGGAPEEPEPEELTVTEAGARYLEAICPVNDTWDAVDLEVDRLRVEVSRGEPGDTDPLAAALKQLERSALAAAKLLDDASVAWPAAAESAVADVRDTLTDDAKQAEKAAKLDGREAVDYSWDGAGDIGAAAAKARAALGLPEDPAAACDAR